MLKEIIFKNKEELNYIMEALSNCNFDDLDYDIFELEFIHDFKNQYSKEFDYASGASKGVLIFKELGFVIKIPFSYCDGCELIGADEGEENWDYCSQEVARYELAEEDNVHTLFLEIEFFDYINNYPIYIQPYAEVLSKISGVAYHSNHCSSTEKERDLVQEIDTKEKYEMLDAGWEADLLVQYGIKKFKQFKQYLEDNWIVDLGDENIGYIGKIPVLIDYARV